MVEFAKSGSVPKNKTTVSDMSSANSVGSVARSSNVNALELTQTTISATAKHVGFMAELKIQSIRQNGRGLKIMVKSEREMQYNEIASSPKPQKILYFSV